MYGQLAEDIGDWMDQHHSNVGIFTVDTLVTIWLRRHGHLYDIHDFPAPFFASRVHNYVNIFVPPLLHGRVNEDHTNASLGALFANHIRTSNTFIVPQERMTSKSVSLLSLRQRGDYM